MNIAPGMMVTRHVRLLEPIGEGAMGTVWLAEHLTLRTNVAVKFISSDLARNNPDVMARFQREASSSAQIKSSHVVQVFDHGVTPAGAPYIVMEFLEGETLGERLARAEQITLRQTAQVLVQTGKALDAAHQLGIVHRDIKPDNIYLSTAEEGLICKVVDFGIAKHTKLADQKGVTLPGTTVGTPEYMSREQVMTAQEVDSSADRWALAVVAYQCLTGVLPFDGETLAMVCVAICGGRFEPPSAWVDDLPDGVDQWFDKALHKDRSQRFDSCKDMALDFMRFLPKIDDEDSWVQSGEFSLPPPSSSEEALQVGPLPPLGGEALVAEFGGQEPSPASSRPQLRRETPTFSGAAAELEPTPDGAWTWRRKAVGAMGALVLVAAGITVGITLTGADAPSTDTTGSAADGTETTSNDNADDTLAEPDPSAASASTDPLSDDDRADASVPDAAVRRRGRLPGPQYPYEPRPKRPRKDLGF